MRLLFPGRHIMTTSFQERYLARLLSKPLKGLGFLGGPIPEGLDLDDRIDEIIFAITSANQEGSRYNPVAGDYRMMGVERLASDLRHAHGLDFRHRVYTIPHFPPTKGFFRYLLDEIAQKSDGEVILTPANTVVLSSTPEVIPLYQQEGFRVLPAELSQLEPPIHSNDTPAQLLTKIINAGEN